MFEVAEDNSEQVIEVVSDPCRQPSDRLHLARMPELLFKHFPRGNVPYACEQGGAVVPARIDDAYLRIDLIPARLVNCNLGGLPRDERYSNGRSDKRVGGASEDHSARCVRKA